MLGSGEVAGICIAAVVVVVPPAVGVVLLLVVLVYYCWGVVSARQGMHLHSLRLVIWSYVPSRE